MPAVANNVRVERLDRPVVVLVVKAIAEPCDAAADRLANVEPGGRRSITNPCETFGLRLVLVVISCGQPDRQTGPPQHERSILHPTGKLLGEVNAPRRGQGMIALDERESGRRPPFGRHTVTPLRGLAMRQPERRAGRASCHASSYCVNKFVLSYQILLDRNRISPTSPAQQEAALFRPAL